MQTHHLKLTANPFALIKSGSKTVESRLYDEKRQAINPGDTLIFTNTDTAETLTVRVVGLWRYASFTDLFSRHDPALFGGESALALTDQIHTFYGPEQEQHYGVVGILIERE